MTPRALFGAMLALVLSAGAVEAQAIPKMSGLPWASGANKPPPADFGRWRGRPVDVHTRYFAITTWELMRLSANAKPTAGAVSVIGLAMLPETHRGQLAQCAAGAFDRQITAIRDHMMIRGWRGSYIRLGWEANRVPGSPGHAFAWAATGDGTSWRACFRRWAGILNPGVKNFPLVWNMANIGTFKHPIENLWPGNDVVDVVATQFYDRCPVSRTPAQFRARLDVKDKVGNPAGPLAWLKWAQARGKRWAMPEWGIGGSTTVCKDHGVDNPVFIQEMHAFLRANATAVAFESYFGGADSKTGTHALYPGSANPKAAAAYRNLW